MEKKMDGKVMRFYLWWVQEREALLPRQNLRKGIFVL